MPEDQLRAPFEELLLDLAELVVATDDVGVTGRTLTIDGQPVPLDASGAVLCHKWKVPCLVPHEFSSPEQMIISSPVETLLAYCWMPFVNHHAWRWGV